MLFQQLPFLCLVLKGLVTLLSALPIYYNILLIIYDWGDTMSFLSALLSQNNQNMCLKQQQQQQNKVYCSDFNRV